MITTEQLKATIEGCGRDVHHFRNLKSEDCILCPVYCAATGKGGYIVWLVADVDGRGRPTKVSPIAFELDEFDSLDEKAVLVRIAEAAQPERFTEVPEGADLPVPPFN